MSEHHCWACRFDWERGSHAGSRIPRDVAALLYEIAVETVEEWGPEPFTITQIWDRARPRAVREVLPYERIGIRWGYQYGPTMHTYVRYAVFDLRAHGLVECLRLSGGSVYPKCLSWRLRPGAAPARSGPGGPPGAVSEALGGAPRA